MGSLRVWKWILILLMFADQCSAQDYYVDPVQGNESNDGNKSAPWKTMAGVLSKQIKILKPGDRLYLRRGYHGILNFKGHNKSDIFIVAEKGHTPMVKSISFNDASHWNIRGLTVSPATVPIGHPDKEIGGRGVSFGKNAMYNTLEDCYLYITQDTSNWNSNNFRYGFSGGIYINGASRNIVRGNHMYNAGKIGINFGSPANYIGYNTVENFSSDGFGIKGNGTMAEHNLIMNSHKVSSNHNDLCQAYGSGTLFRYNELRAYSDPKQPFLDNGVQGLGMFDGIKKNWVIHGNLIRVNHVIGIWALAQVTNFKITDNIVTRADGNRQSRRGPTIAIKKANKARWPKKSGATPKNVTITGNKAWGYEFELNNRGTDAVIARNAKIKSWSAPDDKTPPSAPTGLVATYLEGYGVDLHWKPSIDNIKVIGYEIYNEGKRVGRTRAGTNFFVVGKSNQDSFTVKAYDYNNNFSNASSTSSSTSASRQKSSEAPSTPVKLKATVINGFGIDLEWEASTDDQQVQAYEIYRDGVKIGRSRVGTTYFDPISTETQASYKVRAYDYDNQFSGFTPSINKANVVVEEPTPDPEPVEVILPVEEKGESNDIVFEVVENENTVDEPDVKNFEQDETVEEVRQPHEPVDHTPEIEDELVEPQGIEIIAALPDLIDEDTLVSLQESDKNLDSTPTSNEIIENERSTEVLQTGSPFSQGTGGGCFLKF